MKEYKQTEERDLFLAKELEDLEKSAASLEDIIVELEKTIDARFTEGLKHINEALGGFFNKLFGGGSAKLFVEEPTSMKSTMLSKKRNYMRGFRSMCRFHAKKSADWRYFPAGSAHSPRSRLSSRCRK